MNRKLFLLLLAGFLFRLSLSPFGTHPLDFNTYLAWSNRLVESGFSSFYQIWSDYLPGYLYILWFLGKLKLLLPFLPTVTLYKLPAIMADVFSAYLIFKLIEVRPLKEVGPQRLAFLAAAAYLFNPAIWANSTLWGQTDSLIVLFSLLWLTALRSHRPLLSGLSLGLGALVKPSLGLIAPLTLILSPHRRFTTTLTIAITTLTVFIIGFLPFAAGQPVFEFITSRLSISLNQYPYTSLHSFNLWQILDGYWQSDLSVFWGLPKQAWGQFLFLATTLIFVFSYLRHPDRSLTAQAKLIGLVFLSSFLFLTRIHERHLLTAFPFFTITAVLRPQFWPVYLWLSLSYLLGLIYSYLAVTSLYQTIIFTPPVMTLFSVLNFATFAFLLKPLSFQLLSLLPVKQPRLPQISLVAHRCLLVTILVFAFATRVIRVNLPSTYYFDEVYHVVTAKAYARNDPAGYEWWHGAPEPDTAYDWLHPPLAKLIQAGSISFFGDNSFSWRFPAVVFGTLSVYLVYLLARELFPKSSVPLLAAVLFSLDGLNLVQSRITMNDIFLTAFVVAAVTSFIKFKQTSHKSSLIAASLFTGLAVSTKWTGVYLLPIFAIIELTSFRFSNLPRYLLAFLIIPAIIYLLSYSQFWLQGHSWGQFIELHNQIWRYQTGLTATHPYQSSALTWPLNLRPVWYYVDYQNTTIANIYALGNPLIFWSGLLAVIYALFAIRHKPILLLVAGYLSLFLPWAFSPRIMFLYHYLPATPFMIILLAWFLLHFPKKFIWLFLTLNFALFIFFYPLWTAIPVPQAWANIFFWLPSWK